MPKKPDSNPTKRSDSVAKLLKWGEKLPFSYPVLPSSYPTLSCNLAVLPLNYPSMLFEKVEASGAAYPSVLFFASASNL